MISSDDVPCGICHKIVSNNQNCILCNKCNFYIDIQRYDISASEYSKNPRIRKEPTILQVSLIRLCIEYLVGNKAVQVLKLVLISFRTSRYFFCSD